MEFLANYDFEINYIKGKENKVADALSRRRHISAMAIINIRLKDQVLQHLTQDDFYIEISHALLKDLQDPRYKDYKLEEDGLLRYRAKMYIPKVSESEE